MTEALYACAMGVIAEWQTRDLVLRADVRRRAPDLGEALDALTAQYLREFAEQERARYR